MEINENGSIKGEKKFEKSFQNFKCCSEENNEKLGLIKVNRSVQSNFDPYLISNFSQMRRKNLKYKNSRNEKLVNNYKLHEYKGPEIENQSKIKSFFRMTKILNREYSYNDFFLANNRIALNKIKFYQNKLPRIIQNKRLFSSHLNSELISQSRSKSKSYSHSKFASPIRNDKKIYYHLNSNCDRQNKIDQFKEAKHRNNSNFYSVQGIQYLSGNFKSNEITKNSYQPIINPIPTKNDKRALNPLLIRKSGLNGYWNYHTKSNALSKIIQIKSNSNVMSFNSFNPFFKDFK